MCSYPGLRAADEETPSLNRAPSTVSSCVTIGMIGYPNVGKSSTINALVGEKKVNVGITPGKTKHFQTINVNEDLRLCDCPGLVFPTFMSSAASLVINGVLPVDQLRDHYPPMDELARRVSKQQVAMVYGLQFPDWKVMDGAALMDGYATARGHYKDHGTLDLTRTARTILKHFIQGRLLYCHPPPVNADKRTEFASSLGMGDAEVNKKLMRLIDPDADAIAEEEEPTLAEEEDDLNDIIPVDFDGVTREKGFKVAPDVEPEALALGEKKKPVAKPTSGSKKASMRAAKPRGRKKKVRNKDVDPYDVQAHEVGVAGITTKGSIIDVQPDDAF